MTTPYRLTYVTWLCWLAGVPWGFTTNRANLKHECLHKSNFPGTQPCHSSSSPDPDNPNVYAPRDSDSGLHLQFIHARCHISVCHLCFPSWVKHSHVYQPTWEEPKPRRSRFDVPQPSGELILCCSGRSHFDVPRPSDSCSTFFGYIFKSHLLIDLPWSQ